MCTFKRSMFETNMDEGKVRELFKKITELSNGNVVTISDCYASPDEYLRLKGEVSESDGKYCEGQILVTSSLVTVKCVGVDTYIATTDKSKEYEFSFARRFGKPTLNGWHFANERDGIWADYAICNHRTFELDTPIELCGETSEVPGYQNGTRMTVDSVVEITLSSEYENALIARTKNNHEFILPLEERIGFIAANFLRNWHLTFEYPPKDNDDAGVDEIRKFVKEFYDFSSCRDTLPQDEFGRKVLKVPPGYGIGIESDDFFIDGISYFLKIQYLGKNRLYVVVDEYAGKLARYDLHDADRDQKRMFKASEGKLTRREIRGAVNKMNVSDYRI